MNERRSAISANHRLFLWETPVRCTATVVALQVAARQRELTVADDSHAEKKPRQPLHQTYCQLRMLENDARIERDHPFGFIGTKVRIYKSTQIIESGRIRIDNVAICNVKTIL
eukprot:1532091-Pleurochrysis_carterae.AAC.1